MTEQNVSQTQELLTKIGALSRYKPRKKALELVHKGKFEEFHRWSSGDGFVAAHGYASEQTDLAASEWLVRPLALDSYLCNEASLIHGDTPEEHQEAQDAELAVARRSVPSFLFSPLEMLLSAGDRESLVRALSWWSSPEQVRARGVNEPSGGGWCSHRAWAAAPLSGFSLSETGLPSLLLKALLVGDFPAAHLLAKHAFVPRRQWWTVSLNDLLARIEHQGPSRQALEASAGRAIDFEAARVWLKNKQALMAEGEGILQSPKLKKAQKTRLVELINSNAMGSSTVAAARLCELAEPELLRLLFARGFNPNTVEAARPVIEQLSDGLLNDDLLQLWLEAGVNLTMRPLGTYGQPQNSTLEQWVIQGKLELVNRALNLAKGLQGLRQHHRAGEPCVGRTSCFKAIAETTSSPLLALALEHDHRDLAARLIREFGCRLEDRDEADGTLCGEFGSAETKGFARSVQDEFEVGSASKSRKKSRQGDGRI